MALSRSSFGSPVTVAYCATASALAGLSIHWMVAIWAAVSRREPEESFIVLRQVGLGCTVHLVDRVGHGRRHPDGGGERLALASDVVDLVEVQHRGLQLPVDERLRRGVAGERDR